VSDDQVLDLACRAGIAVEWTNAADEPQRVAPDVLRRLLDALGLPSATSAQLAESRERLRARQVGDGLPPLITATSNEPIVVPRINRLSADRARLILEDGSRRDLLPTLRPDGRLSLGAISQPGYHELRIGNRTATLAVAPATCFTLDDVVPHPRLWGLAVQLYGLRRIGDGGIGDTGGVSTLAASAAEHGADALALSPMHALFGADATRYGPYSPSSRLFLNPLHADAATLLGADRVAAARQEAGLAAEMARLEALPSIDWAAAAAAKLTLLRRLFDGFLADLEGNGGPLAADFAGFRREGGELLEHHARFEALHAVRLTTNRDAWSWRSWPAQWQDPEGDAVKRFAADNARDVTFQIFLQWVADRSLAAAQASARRAGMRIGLIADLAVGIDSGGSHAWSRQHDLLVGLHVGAPPDLFNPLGQSWGLTAFSPPALVAGGFAPFLATLQATMRHAGGVRIDHAMGLSRLWLVPDGATADQGAYLTYPLEDLLRLIRLESFRRRAIVIGEDLGTVPTGFRDRLEAAGISGTRVLWFERDETGFRPPDAWPPSAVAMTTTHDLPTVAGWWRGNDIAARARLDRRLDADRSSEKRQRDADRKLLWQAFCAAGAAVDTREPDDPARAVDAAIKFVARTPSRLALLPLEDALGVEDQPNLPGTVDEYPNWRHRYPVPAPEIFARPDVRARARWLTRRGRR
jgi:4-alpha-glucanotransferase